MVKLASVRATRLYGPVRIKDQCEDINAFLYLLATLLFLVGVVFLLPGWTTTVGLSLIMAALAIIVVVNLHDLYAQLAGFDFRLPLVTMDPQLALIEVLAPLVQAIGGVLFFIGVMLLLRVSLGAFDAEEAVKVMNHAYGLLIAGPAIWLLGSINNAFQVYERTDTRVQFMQKMVSIPFVISTTLLLVGAILSYEAWPLPAAAIQARRTAVWIGIVAVGLLVFAAIMNAVRVLEMQQVDHLGGLLEPLRGGAQQRLDHERDEEETLVDRAKYAHDVEEGSSYKQVVVPAERGVER